MSPKAAYFWPVLCALVAVAGEVVRFTLTSNRGAAFGIDAGPHGRWLLVTLSLGVLVGLSALYRQASARDRLLVFALGLTTGGAVGNLLDRVRSPRGVVDFIDLGFGDDRFWIFNLADAGISVGAILLGWTLWRRLQGPSPEGAR